MFLYVCVFTFCVFFVCTTCCGGSPVHVAYCVFCVLLTHLIKNVLVETSLSFETAFVCVRLFQ